MRKSITLLGVLALVLGVAAGATAAGKSVFATGSVDSRVVKDRSLRLVDLSAASEGMIRSGWQVATGRTKITEANLDPALAAKVNRPDYTPPTTLRSKVGTIAGIDNAVAAGDRFGRSVDFPLPAPKAIATTDVVIVSGLTRNDACPGSFADPKAAAGKLCVYVGGTSEGAANASDYAVFPIAGLGFHFTWKAQAPGETRVVATYAYQAA